MKADLTELRFGLSDGKLFQGDFNVSRRDASVPHALNRNISVLSDVERKVCVFPVLV